MNAFSFNKKKEEGPSTGTVPLLTLETSQQPCSRPLRRLSVRLPSPLTTWLVAGPTLLAQLRLPNFFTSCFTKFISSLNKDS